MTAVESPGNCVIPPRIRPLWSQRRWNPAPFLQPSTPCRHRGTQNPCHGGASAASWIKRLCWRISVPFALRPVLPPPD